MPNTETENNAQVAKADENPTPSPDPQQNVRQQSKMEWFLSSFKAILIRVFIVYAISSLFRRPAPPQTAPGVETTPASAARNIFADGTPISLYVYLSEYEDLDFSKSSLFWHQDDLVYGGWAAGENKDGVYYFEKNVEITPHLRNNGSLYLHAFVTRQGESPNPKDKNYGKNQMSYVSKQLNKYKKIKPTSTKNLLTGESTNTVDESKIISHWHPNFTINLVTDQTHWTYGSVPVPINEYVKFTTDGKFYKPILYANNFWNMARDYKPLNESLVLRIEYQPLSLFKWQLYAAQSMRQSWNIFGDKEAESDEEQDTLKETLMDNNPYLLGVTIIVATLHSVFELLAFKNDIQFWNNRNSLEGLSVRSVFFSVFQSLIVLLYVLDNETNTLVRISCGIGLLIELWKIHKVVDIKFENGWPVFKDKGSYVESSTRQYDNLAFKYLSWVCFPLLVGYSIYALLYLEHKGWYSFVLDLLYGYLLTFGFIMMTPQLFINYKLKSVAHLPWRMLTYKFLNTFIDDMFAFVIKMPTMYRIGCLRDDVIFLVFLYQKWIYPVDKTRRNEFGYIENDINPQIQENSGNNEQNQENNQRNNIATVENKKDK